MKLSVHPNIAMKFRISGFVPPLPHVLSCRAHMDNSNFTIWLQELRKPPSQWGQPFAEMTTNPEPYPIRIPFDKNWVICSSTHCHRIMRRIWDILSITLCKISEWVTVCLFTRSIAGRMNVWRIGCLLLNYCGCINLFCYVWVCVCAGILVICVLVFTMFFIVWTVFLYFFIYAYLFLLFCPY